MVSANTTVGNYYMRAVCQTACGMNLNNGIKGTAHGILHYQGADEILPTSVLTSYVDACVDEPLTTLKPVVAKSVPSSNFACRMLALPVRCPSRVAVGG